MNPTRVLALVDPRLRDLGCAIKDILDEAGSSAFAYLEAIQQNQSNNGDTAACTETIERVQPDVILICSDHRRSEETRAILRAARSVSPEMPVMVFADGNNPQQMCELLDFGVQDFFTAPVKAVDLLPRLWKFKPQAERRPAVSLSAKERLGLTDFIGESPALVAALRRIPAVAQCDTSVLITGETGTGKELCARAIHYLSGRADKAFMPINCGAIPLELIENQLFGHEQGAFTGASSAAPGLLRAADGGTVLLDEVDSLPLAAQVKLLRLLQERQFQPLGSSKTLTVNIRIVAACNTNLEQAVRAGRFRQDLYHRLNVVPIELPPLRQRREDIPRLARHFLVKYAQKFVKPARELSSGALQKLVVGDWLGNVRELESVIERAVILGEGATIRGQDILLSVPEVSNSESFKNLKAQAVERFERSYLQQMLCAHHGNITKASRAAKKDRRAFWQLMRKHHLAVPADAPPHRLIVADIAPAG